jgi:hypothetical protein
LQLFTAEIIALLSQRENVEEQNLDSIAEANACGISMSGYFLDTK